MIHVAGNSVLDMPLRHISLGDQNAADGWTSANVQFLDQPVEGVLGGCGAATAYVLGKLGQSVSLNTQLGWDPFGKIVRAWLQDAGVEVVGSSADYTATNVIPLTENGARQSLFYTGLKIDWTQSNDVLCDYFFASGYGQVAGEDIVSLTHTFERLKARGTRVVFDPGPWFMMRADRALMQKAWNVVDVLVGTQEELSTWFDFSDVMALAERLTETVPNVVVKDGANGAVFATRRGDMGMVETERIEKAYTVGAGDTFNAGLLHYFQRGHAIQDAVKFAVTLATKTVACGRGALGAME